MESDASESWPTWSDVEHRARYDPFLQAVVTAVRQGASREQALIAGVLGLSRAYEDQKTLIVNAVRNMSNGLKAR